MKNTENNQDLHDFYKLIYSMGGSDEDIKELWRLALETIGTKKEEPEQ